jgi:hypothetical protein
MSPRIFFLGHFFHVFSFFTDCASTFLDWTGQWAPLFYYVPVSFYVLLFPDRCDTRRPLQNLLELAAAILQSEQVWTVKR